MVRGRGRGKSGSATRVHPFRNEGQILFIIVLVSIRGGAVEAFLRLASCCRALMWGLLGCARTHQSH